MRSIWLSATLFAAAVCVVAGCTAQTPIAPNSQVTAGNSFASDVPESAATPPSPSLPITTGSPEPSQAPTTEPATSGPRIAPTTSSSPSPSPSSSSLAISAPVLVSTAGLSDANAQLAVLPVKGRAPKTGYTRAQFGEAWTDNNNAAGGRNGCDTRNDILRRDLTDLVIKPGSNGCTVLSGTLHDSYTATTILFSRGVATSTRVQIDHMVALSDAWQTGAQQLTTEQRVDLANDPRNLQAVDGPANEAKGDSDAASWLPPNKSYRCTYVARQIQVKTSYHLWVTAAEKAAMTQQLTRCTPTPETTPTPTPAAAPRTSPTPATTPTPTPAQAPTPAVRSTLVPTTAPPAAPTTSADPPADADVYYKNCAAVRAAGKAPLLAGEPGYRAGLDRDHDGVACET